MNTHRTIQSEQSAAWSEVKNPSTQATIGAPAGSEGTREGGGILAAQPLRVLVADDHPVSRSGVRAAVRTIGSVGLVLEAANGFEAVNAFRASRPDAVFMDDGMPRMNGWRATSQIVEEFPDARVVIMSMRTDAANLQRACNCGALGYLLKTDPVAEFRRAFQEVLRGGVYISPTVSERVARAAAERRKAALQKLRKL